MTILSIDTALRTCGIGVMRDAQVVFSQSQPMPRGQDQALAPAIKDALAQSNCTMQDLSAVVVTTGPGSFTGIRVGMAFARGLTSTLNIPLIGLTTTEVLSSQAGGSGIAVIEIKKDAYIVQLFEKGDPQQPFLAVNEQELKDFIAENNTQSVVTHTQTVQEILEVECEILLPDPATMLALAAERVGKAGEIVRPVYIRQADVTVKN